MSHAPLALPQSTQSTSATPEPSPSEAETPTGDPSTQAAADHPASDRSRARATARELADVSTGEVILLRDAARPPRHGDAFTMLFQKDLLALVCSPVGVNLTALQLRVLLGVWSLVGFDNLMPLNVTDLARRLGAHRTSVSRALGVLERLDLLRILEPGAAATASATGSGAAGPVDVGARHLRVNPHISYRGRVGQRRDAVARDTWAPSGSALANMHLFAKPTHSAQSA